MTTLAPRVANPYRPGVGLRPAYLAGRDEDIRTFKRVLASAPGIPGNARVTGLRGVGKTVLLQRLQETADEEGWATISVELEPRHCTDAALAALVDDKVSDLMAKLSLTRRVRDSVTGVVDAARRAVSITYEGFEWSLSGDLDPASREVAAKIFEASQEAQKHGKRGLVLLFDEAQILTDEKSPEGNHPLSTLVAAVSTLQKQHAAVSLVLCGLPTLAVNLLTARTYTERMFRGFKIGSLTAEDAAAAFTEPLSGGNISAEPGLAARIATEVEGYPYFVQLWGAELWEAANESGLTTMTAAILDVIVPRIRKRLDLDFYEPRIESLTPAEQDLLMATATCRYPPLLVSDLNAAIEKSAGNVNVLLGRLVTANILYRPRKGQYQYTAPQFKDFLNRRNEARDRA